MKDEIYILLPVHNRKHLTLTFVENLKLQTSQNFRLVVIDDGSTDGTSDAILHHLPTSIILKGNGNLWWAGSLQMAINYLKEQNLSVETPILIINDDTLIPANFLETGRGEMNLNPRSIICARNNLNGTIQSSGVDINWKIFGFTATEDSSKVKCLPSRGIFLKFSDILAIGEFRPRLLPHYLSDYEFTYRAFMKGYKLICPPHFHLSPMLAETGIRVFDHKKGFAYIKILFSKRCVSNPIYLMNFVLMASPMKYKLRNLFDVLLSATKGIIKSFISL